MNVQYLFSPDFLEKTLSIVEGEFLKGVYESNLRLRYITSDLLSRNKFEFKNMLIKFLEEFPNLRWNFQRLSSNPNINMEYIEDHQDLQWNYDDITVNPNITIEFIRNHINDISNFISLSRKVDINEISNNRDLPWLWNYVSMNPTLTLDFIRDNIDLDWDWNYLSKKSFITIDFIKNNLTKNWNWYVLPSVIPVSDILDNLQLPWTLLSVMDNPTLTADFLEKTNLTYRKTGKSSKITMDDIENNRISPSWKDVSQNPNLTIDFIKRNIDENFSWYDVTRNPNITMDDIENNPDLPWDWCNISGNPNITIDFVLNNLDKPFYWRDLQYNKFVTIEFIRFIMDEYEKGNINNECQKKYNIKDSKGDPFDFNQLSRKFSLSDIENNPDLPWSFNHISYNPNLTVDFYRKYSDPEVRDLKFPNLLDKTFNINEISWNKFHY